MNSNILIISLLAGICYLPIFGQGIELHGGLNTNHFLDYGRNVGHFQSSHGAGFGYSIGLAVDGIRADWMIQRLDLKFDKYYGSLKASDGGLGGRYTTEAEIEKSFISIGIYPVKLQITRRFYINIGLGSIKINFRILSRYK